jgi:hypothetical protein
VPEELRTRLVRESRLAKALIRIRTVPNLTFDCGCPAMQAMKDAARLEIVSSRRRDETFLHHDEAILHLRRKRSETVAL